MTINTFMRVMYCTGGRDDWKSQVQVRYKRSVQQRYHGHTCSVTLKAMAARNAVMQMLTRAVECSRGNAKEKTAIPTMKKMGTMSPKKVDAHMRFAWNVKVTCTTNRHAVQPHLHRHIQTHAPGPT